MNRLAPALLVATLALAGTAGCAAPQADDTDAEASAATSSALDGNRVQKAGTLVIGDWSNGGTGALCSYVVGITKVPTASGAMTASGTVNCEARNVSFTASIYLTRGDGYFDGTNLCAACGTAIQHRNGTGQKTLAYGGHRGTWTATIFFADDAWQLNASEKVSVKI